MFVEKDQAAAENRPKKLGASVEKPAAPPVLKERVRPPSNGKTVDASIQKGRQKDPPEVYFESGLQYFKNGNFEDALKNFTHADSLDPQPKFLLWMGKTLRQLGNFDQLLFVMKRLVATYPESDVADDALFEIAFCYQSNNEYELAVKTYTKLAEQYPFGVSFSNGENFRDVAHKQCQLMRAEIISTLKVLGYAGEDLESLCAAFQKDKGLPVTGLPSRPTVLSIKAAYAAYLKAEADQEERRERMNKYRTAGYAIGGVLALNGLLLFIMNRIILARRKHLAVLSQMLSDLKTGER